MAGQNLEPHTMICEAIPDGYRFRSSRTNAPVVYHLDGKNYKTTGAGGFGQAVGADEYSAKRLSANVIEATSLRAKKPVGTIRREVSSDGRVLTSVSGGVSPSGEKINFVLVFDKQ